MENTGKKLEEAIQNLLEGKLEAMRENLGHSLSRKAVQALDEKKKVIGSNYLGNK